MQPLERRFILGAPLALASDGLVLASPTASEDLLDAEPAPAPAPAEATAPPPPPLAPEADPLSPAGDPKKAKPGGGGTTLLSSSSGGSYYVDVWREPIPGDVTNVLEFGETSGQFRFHATACGTSGLPYGVTITYERGGDASPTTDLSGPFSAGTPIYVPLDGSETNKSGTAVLGFSASDDELDESDESFWARILSGQDGNGQAANVLPMNQQWGTVASNDYTCTLKTRTPVQVSVSGQGGDAGAQSTTIAVDVSKGNSFKDGIPYDYEIVRSGQDPRPSTRVSGVQVTETTANGGRAAVTVKAEVTGTCLVKIYIRPPDHTPYVISVSVQVNP